MLVPWTPLSPSRRERSLRRLAQVLAWVAAAGLLYAAVRDGPVDPVPLLGALMSAVAGMLAGRGGDALPVEIGVDRSGALAVRAVSESGAPLEQGLRCVFAAPWLITLRHGTIWVRIWPDSVPGDVFRRFWVHVRWSPGRQPADRTASTAPGRER